MGADIAYHTKRHPYLDTNHFSGCGRLSAPHPRWEGTRLVSLERCGVKISAFTSVEPCAPCKRCCYAALLIAHCFVLQKFVTPGSIAKRQRVSSLRSESLSALASDR